MGVSEACGRAEGGGPRSPGLRFRAATRPSAGWAETAARLFPGKTNPRGRGSGPAVWLGGSDCHPPQRVCPRRGGGWRGHLSGASCGRSVPGGEATLPGWGRSASRRAGGTACLLEAAPVSSGGGARGPCSPTPCALPPLQVPERPGLSRLPARAPGQPGRLGRTRRLGEREPGFTFSLVLAGRVPVLHGACFADPGGSLCVDVHFHLPFQVSSVPADSRARCEVTASLRTQET